MIGTFLRLLRVLGAVTLSSDTLVSGSLMRLTEGMTKLGFIQDLSRGVMKLLGGEKSAATQPVVVAASAAPGVESLYERSIMFLLELIAL